MSQEKSCCLTNKIQTVSSTTQPKYSYLCTHLTWFGLYSARLLRQFCSLTQSELATNRIYTEFNRSWSQVHHTYKRDMSSILTQLTHGLNSSVVFALCDHKYLLHKNLFHICFTSNRLFPTFIYLLRSLAHIFSRSLNPNPKSEFSYLKGTLKIFEICKFNIRTFCF